MVCFVLRTDAARRAGRETGKRKEENIVKQRLDKHFLLNRAFVGTLLALRCPLRCRI